MLFGITKEWLASKTAYRILSCAAFFAVVLTAVFIFFNVVDEDLWIGVADRVNDSVVLSSVAGIIVTPMVLAVCLLYVAMWIYWATVDASSPDTKTIWFFLMIFGMWVAAIVYYFVVYRRQTLSRLSDSRRTVQL